MGRVVTIWSCGPDSCGTAYQAARPLSFAYDWVGNLTQEVDGATGTINYGRSIAGEVTSITNATYTNLPYNPPNLVSSVVNGPSGPISYKLGNGLNAYWSYDSLTRPAGAFVCNGPAAVSCSGGTQIYGTTSLWNGTQMQQQSDTVLGQSVNFTYGDGFNRLTARTVTGGTVQNYTYAYDLYGNRVSQTALQGGYNFFPTINAANNQITTSGYTYDPAGNMLNDAVNTYSYDAEGNVRKVVSASGTTQYVYDAFNHRVHVQTPSATTEYIYDYAGRRVSSWLSPNNNGNEGRIYWDGRQVAYRSADGTTYFDHQDTLGTERMRTNYVGGVGSSYKSLPWGDGYTATINNSGADQDNNHFAGLERDAESGTEHAEFRNYASVQGRWLAPDPYLGSYDFTNPQSMNRYAYALNNPTSFIDPSGLKWCWASVFGFGTCDGVSGGDGGGDTPPDGYSPSGFNTSDGLPIYTNAGGDSWIGNGASPGTSDTSSTGQLSASSYTDPFGYFNGIGSPQASAGFSDARGGSGLAPSNPKSAFSGAVSIPVLPGVLVSFPVAITNNKACVGLGGGFGSPGYGVDGGIVHTSSSNIVDVLKGASVSVGATTGWWGIQWSHNSSGIAAGNLMGTPGVSLTVSYSGCF